MRIILTNAAAALLVLVPSRTATELAVQPESRLWVEGTSTIKSFTCKVPEFALKVSGDGAVVTGVLSAHKAVKTVELTLASAKIDCGSGTMNDHIEEAVKAEVAPTIKFTLSGYDVTKDSTGVGGTIRGALSLGGVEKPIDVVATATDGGTARCASWAATSSALLRLRPQAPQPDVRPHQGRRQGAGEVRSPPEKLNRQIAVTLKSLDRAMTRNPLYFIAAAALVATPALSAQSTHVASKAVRTSVTADTTAAKSGTYLTKEDSIILAKAKKQKLLYRTIELQNIRPADQRGNNTFEAPKTSSVPFDGMKLSWGGAFMQEYQALGHKNTAAPNVVAGVNANQLIIIGHGFNNAVANLDLGVQLAQGIRMNVTTYASARHHQETWVKDGYVLMDASPIDNPILNTLMEKADRESRPLRAQLRRPALPPQRQRQRDPQPVRRQPAHGCLHHRDRRGSLLSQQRPARDGRHHGRRDPWPADRGGSPLTGGHRQARLRHG